MQAFNTFTDNIDLIKNHIMTSKANAAKNDYLTDAYLILDTDTNTISTETFSIGNVPFNGKNKIDIFATSNLDPDDLTYIGGVEYAMDYIKQNIIRAYWDKAELERVDTTPSMVDLSDDDDDDDEIFFNAKTGEEI